MVTERGMRLKRAMGAGRKLSTHNALWCLFTLCGELWVVRGKESGLLNHLMQSLSWANVGHRADGVQTHNISEYLLSKKYCTSFYCRKGQVLAPF